MGIKRVKEIIEELQITSGTNDKINILKSNSENELLKLVLEYTYNPFKKYKISEDVLNTISSDDSSSKTIFMLLDTLALNNINNSLRNEIAAFKNSNLEHWDLYSKMILKDLRCNISSKTINKVWKDLIPTSETGKDVKCMLATKFDFNKPPKDKMFITEKLDGIRTWCIIDKNRNVELYTRQGKLIEGCKEIENAIYNLKLENVILDGELLASGEDIDYSNVYKETTKRVKNKNQEKNGLAFHIFDIITMEEYNNKIGINRYSERRKMLYSIKENEFVKVVKCLYEGSDILEVLLLLDEYREKGAEGLMCNLDKVYEFKRSNSCLKLKVMQSCDLKIIGFQEGKGKFKNTLGSLIVNYKGNSVGVGGLSDADREYIWNNRDSLIGRVAEIKYFEITKDKDGVESLRFPIFLGIREEGKEVSYH
ncbi:MAG: hypothetical protein IJ094_10795 [Bacilli bacterium]|nr:hypothetical protein [Bacilli bacterium]